MKLKPFYLVCSVVAFAISSLVFSPEGAAQSGGEHDHAGEAHGDEEPFDASWGNVDPADQSPQAVRYRAATDELRKILKLMRREIVHHHTNQYTSRDSKLDEWLKVVDNSRAAHHEYRLAAVGLYLSDPVKYASLGNLLFYMLKTSVEADHFEDMAEVGKALVEKNYNRKELVGLAGFACFVECDFENAAKFMRQASLVSGVPNQAIAALEPLKELWAKEKALREKEANENLPRVKIATTKGSVVIELFENEAPESVANFIYLTEHKFYNGRPIFRVEEHFVAQMGCERGDGTGNPGYTIRGEMKEANARGHFRGSVGVALGSDPQTHQTDYNSGSAQFYFTFLPSPQMNGEYCVIGRIVEGIDCLGDLVRIQMGDKEWMKKNQGLVPDVMVRAEVLRKRDHEYVPSPISGRLPFGR